MESAPRLPLGTLFLRFLRFGSLAWGGPVAQIGMLQKELVDDERWISRERFRGVLAVYQALPGPEAHELCVYFGMLSRGRIGGLLAGLGFMLPGFVLMFALSWLYVRYGLGAQGVQAVFGAVQAAVVALIARAAVRIGSHAVHDAWLAAIAVAGALAHLAGVNFGFILSAGALVYALAGRLPRRWVPSVAALLVVGLTAGLWFARSSTPAAEFRLDAQQGAGASAPSLTTLAWSGLRTGSLTFGGAYTAIPFLQNDAVTRGGWMSESEFLDGLALSGILPAPLIIFATFVGFLGGGVAGALVVTAGIFAPAFAFTLLGHEPLERLVSNARLKRVLEGVTAAVTGLIAATALELARAVLSGPLAITIFVVVLVALFRWSSRLLVPAVIAAAALVGWLAGS